MKSINAILEILSLMLEKSTNVPFEFLFDYDMIGNNILG